MRRILLALILAIAAPASAQQPDDATLDALLAAPKFEPGPLYTGADTPEDKPLLTTIINQAISDIRRMPGPRSADLVRSRLTTVIADVENFATEDRAQAYRYCIQIWRAAGFTEPSQLFEASDFEVLNFF